jgi:hypothetical protein
MAQETMTVSHGAASSSLHYATVLGYQDERRMRLMYMACHFGVLAFPFD